MGQGIFKINRDIWTEKYRPQTLDDYIASSDLKENFKKFIESQNFGHLLFAGPPGVGKSTIAHLLTKAIDCDVLYINAAQERGIDTVRDKIMNFCVTSSFAALKVVVLDEFSETTPIAQNSLKSVLEQYSKHTRFIFTANHVDNIVEAIRSRCQEFDVVPMSKDQIKDRCKFILESESIDYEENELDEIIRHYFPDARKIIQYLDQQSIGKVLKLDKEFFKILKYEKRVIDLLKKVNASNEYDVCTEIRQIMADARVKSFISLYKYLFEKVDEYCKKEKVFKVIIKIHEGMKNDSSFADKEINMVATLLQIVEILAN